MAYEHEPVLLNEVVRALSPADGEWFVDCTVGGGGHAAALLGASRCRVVGLDRDPAALAAARERCSTYGDRLITYRAAFSQLGVVLAELGLHHVDGILADLGVSSPQLDQPERGFSFRNPGPLDMRMDPDAPLTAATLVNAWSEQALEQVIREYGEERRARQIARAIVGGRPWRDTASLGAAVARAAGRGKGRIHPATRTFQALRIAVNDELRELQSLLPQAVDRLKPGGRLAIIAFHSLEDRIVKHFLAEQAGRGRPRDPYGNPQGPVRLAVHSPVRPSPHETNPRARSARLRTATRLPWNTL